WAWTSADSFSSSTDGPCGAAAAAPIPAKLSINRLPDSTARQTLLTSSAPMEQQRIGVRGAPWWSCPPRYRTTTGTRLRPIVRRRGWKRRAERAGSKQRWPWFGPPRIDKGRSSRQGEGALTAPDGDRGRTAPVRRLLGHARNARNRSCSALSGALP